MVALASLTPLPGAQRFFGHNLELRNNRLPFLARTADTEAMTALLAPGGRLVLANDPEVLGEVMVDKARSFIKSRMVRWSLAPLAGDGLFTSEDPLWRRQRKIMAPLFARSQLDRYALDMLACAERTIAPWRDGEVVAMAQAMTHLTMGVAGKTLFDADTFDEADEIGRALTVALDWSGHSGGSLYGIAHIIARVRLGTLAQRLPALVGGPLEKVARRFERPIFVPGKDGRNLRAAIRTLDQRVQRMIADRRAQGLARPDLLSRLLAARDEDGQAMDDRQIRDEVLTLFVAGHETTATGLAWTFQLLCEHPEWYARVQAEVDALPGPPPTVADLPRLGLCLRAFKESLRIYPPVYLFGRQSIEEVEIGGVTLPPETFVLISPYALHRRQRVWPEPERFDPDRFLPASEAGRSRYAWLPFGAGARVCIGNHFAMMEAPLVMATILRRFRLEALGHELPVVSAALRPGGPMRMRVHARA
jgi:cytochrome P450